MYRCQHCGKDASVEVQAEIDQVADSLSPGQTPIGLYDYFENRYVCKKCQKGVSPSSRQASAQRRTSRAIPTRCVSVYQKDCPPQSDPCCVDPALFELQKKVSLHELARILSLVASPPNFRTKPVPGDLKGPFDEWFDGGAIVSERTGGVSQYWFVDGLRVDWAGLAPSLRVRVEWPDGRRVTISQEADIAALAAEVAQTTNSGERKRIGRYEVTGNLEEWMYGPVVAGVDPASGHRVAIKTLLKRAQDEGFAAPHYVHLLREARVGNRVKHAGIVQSLEFGEDGDVAYVVQELLNAKKLETYFYEGVRFQADDIATIMGDLCAALEAVHEAGIVHSNLQPANVLITGDGSAKLTDFSKAYLSSPDSHLNERELTEITEIVPALDYKSPEVILGDLIDRRTDVFSAGILLYQLATGKNPFPGTSPWTVAKRILVDDPLPASSLNKELSTQFDAVVAKALAKDPADRYQTARELNAALQAGIK